MRLLGFVEARRGCADKVDVALGAVGLAQSLEALEEELAVEPVAVLEGELRAQSAGIGDDLVVGEGDAAEPVALALFDRNQDVNALALGRTKGERVDAAGVAHVGLRLAGVGLGVAVLLVELADELGVLIELGGVEGAREDVLEEDGVRDADGLGEVHRRAEVAGAER